MGVGGSWRALVWLALVLVCGVVFCCGAGVVVVRVVLICCGGPTNVVLVILSG